MISADGMHFMNSNLGPNGDKVLMVIEELNVSHFLDQRRNMVKSKKKVVACFQINMLKLMT
jgi:hypothetical protein